MGMFRSGKRYHLSMVLPATFDAASEHIHDSLQQYGDGTLFTGSQFDANAPRNWTAGRRTEVAADGHATDPEFRMQIALEKTQMDERCRLTVNAVSSTRKLSPFEREVLNGSWAKGILNQCLGLTAKSPGNSLE